MIITDCLYRWRNDPPKTAWLKLEIGKDGWVVQVLAHGDHFKPKIIFEVDDDGLHGFDDVAAAIEEAYAVAIAREKP
jgi:hypothetical protein